MSNENTVHIGYTFNNLDETDLNERIAEIKGVFSDIFENSFSEVSFVRNEEKSEIIFSIDTPILESPLQHRLFFMKLDKLFTETGKLNPYFCEFKGDPNDR